MTAVKGVLRELLPALLLAGLGALGAGWILGLMVPRLQAHAGILIMVPGLMALRGNINGAMGSRLGSAVHLGLVRPGRPFGPVTQANFAASLVLSLAVGMLVGALGWGFSLVAGLPTVSLGLLVLVGGTTGLLSGLLLAAITIAIVLTAAHTGVDPDNVTGPLLTTVGDVITMGVLFFVLGVI